MILPLALKKNQNKPQTKNLQKLSGSKSLKLKALELKHFRGTERLGMDWNVKCYALRDSLNFVSMLQSLTLGR